MFYLAQSVLFFLCLQISPSLPPSDNADLWGQMCAVHRQRLRFNNWKKNWWIKSLNTNHDGKIQLKLHLMFQKLAGKKGIAFKYFSDNWERGVFFYFFKWRSSWQHQPCFLLSWRFKDCFKAFFKCKTLWSLTAKVLMQDKNRTLPHLKIRSVSWMGLAPLCMSVSTQAYTSWQFSGFPYMVVWPTYSDQTHTGTDTNVHTGEKLSFQITLLC